MAAIEMPDCAGTVAGDGGAPPPDGGGGESRRRRQQQNPQLDYYAPLVSARRRYAHNCATDTSDEEEEDGGGAGAAADSENAAPPAIRQPDVLLLQGSCRRRQAAKPSPRLRTPGAVPFRWEQSPGRPKTLHSDTHSVESSVTVDDKLLPKAAAAAVISGGGADRSSSSSSHYSSPPHSSSAGGAGSSCSSYSPPAGLAAADLRRPCSAPAPPNSVPASSEFIVDASPVAAPDPISCQLSTDSITPTKSSALSIHNLAAKAGEALNHSQSSSTTSSASAAVATTSVAVSCRRRRNLSLPGPAYHDSEHPTHCGTSNALLWSSATSSPMASASIFPDLHRRRYPDSFRSAIAVTDPPSASAESVVAHAAYAFTRNLCIPESPVRVFSDCVHPNNTTSIEDPYSVSDHSMTCRNSSPPQTNTVRRQETSCGSPAGDGSGRNRMSNNNVEKIQKKPWHWRQRSGWMSSCRNEEDIGASIISWERLSAGELDEPAEAPGGSASIPASPPSTGGGIAGMKGGRISDGRQIQAMRRVMAQMLSKATAAAKLVKKPSLIHGRSNSISALSTIIHCNKQNSVDVIVVENSGAAVNDIASADLEAAALREVRAILKQKQQLIFGNKINSSSSSAPLSDMVSPAVAVSMTTKVDKSSADQPTSPKSQIYQESTEDHASTNAQATQISPDDDADYKTGSDRSVASSDVDGHDHESAVDLVESQEMEASSAKDAIAQRNGDQSPPAAAMKLSNLSKRVGKVLRVETRGLNTAESEAVDRMNMAMKIKDAVEFEEQYYKALQNHNRIQEAHHSNNGGSGGTICRNVLAAVPPVFPAKCQKNAVNIDQIKASDIGWPLGISGCPPPIKSPSVLRSPSSSSSSFSSSSSTSSTKQSNNNLYDRDQCSSKMPVDSQNHFTESSQQPLVPLPPPLPPSPAGGSWLKKTLSSAVSLMGTSDYSSSTNSPCRVYKFSPVSASAHQWYTNKWEVMLKDRAT